MGWLLAAIYDGYMRKTEAACLHDWRAEVLGPARGAVLELGAGTGANLAHYGPAVDRLVLAEPDPHMRRKLAARLDGARARDRAALCDAPGERLPFADASFDTVVSTLVLCSVPDPARTLAEARRVLRPGGALLFIEHVADEARPERLAWQRRMEPLWRRVSGDCHLTRTTGATLAAAGFTLEHVTRASLRKALPWLRPTIRGTARAPG